METQFPPLGPIHDFVESNCWAKTFNLGPMSNKAQALMETGPEFNANYTLVGVKPFLMSLKSWLIYYAHY